jgi:hypothetical protein
LYTDSVDVERCFGFASAANNAPPCPDIDDLFATSGSHATASTQGNAIASADAGPAVTAALTGADVSRFDITASNDSWVGFGAGDNLFESSNGNPGDTWATFPQTANAPSQATTGLQSSSVDELFGFSAGVTVPTPPAGPKSSPGRQTNNNTAGMNKLLSSSSGSVAGSSPMRTQQDLDNLFDMDNNSSGNSVSSSVDDWTALSAMSDPFGQFASTQSPPQPQERTRANTQLGSAVGASSFTFSNTSPLVHANSSPQTQAFTQMPFQSMPPMPPSTSVRSPEVQASAPPLSSMGQRDSVRMYNNNMYEYIMNLYGQQADNIANGISNTTNGADGFSEFDAFNCTSGSTVTRRNSFRRPLSARLTQMLQQTPADAVLQMDTISELAMGSMDAQDEPANNKPPENGVRSRSRSNSQSNKTPPRTHLCQQLLFQFINSFPESFYCPIGMEMMCDPVVCSDGHSYERTHIEDWFSRSDISPITGNPVNKDFLVPNHALRLAIESMHSQVEQLLLSLERGDH